MASIDENCEVCIKIRDKKANIIFEDSDVAVIMPHKSAVLGHLRVMPKGHETKVDSMDEKVFAKAMSVANFASSILFEMTKAHATNILFTETDKHFYIDVLARKEGDGLNFSWKPKPMPPEDMDDAQLRIKDKADEAKKIAEPKKEVKQEVKPEASKEDWIARSLTRIP